MNKITFYKDGGRSIEVNDIEGAAEAMIKDGWRLDDAGTKKAAVAKVEAVEKAKTVEPKPVKSRRRSRS
jgi:hypothetical protein